MSNVQTLTQFPNETATDNAGAEKVTQLPLEFAYTINPGLNSVQTLTQMPVEEATDNNGKQTVEQYLLEFAYIPAFASRIGFALGVGRKTVS